MATAQSCRQSSYFCERSSELARSEWSTAVKGACAGSSATSMALLQPSVASSKRRCPTAALAVADRRVRSVSS